MQGSVASSRGDRDEEQRERGRATREGRRGAEWIGEKGGEKIKIIPTSGPRTR